MPKAKPPKVSLSGELEKAFFSKKIEQNQVLALKRLCEGYHRQKQSLWRESVYRPYSCYFGFLTALKTKRVFQELKVWGYLERFQQSKISLLDYGAGSLGGSLGAYEFFKGEGLSIDRVIAVDRDPRPVDWAKTEFAAFLPSEVSFAKRWPRLKKSSAQIHLMANVWNEIWQNPKSQFTKNWLAQLRLASRDDLFIIIEPADKLTNQRLLRFRDQLRNLTQILLPCTHALACPALAQDEWCHEEVEYSAPARYWELVRKLGFRKSRLSFSLLVFGQQASAFSETQARVVSQDVGGKGRCEKFLCMKGRRWKESLLVRDQNEKNQGFFSAPRGGVIDSRSTLSREA
ncbi:MAG: hypothetical protein EA369_03920 [Bradymonadales bacterium]|nr:MAG: hypothetical protein EA369_03920 [Bradymonadales bacterium]